MPIAIKPNTFSRFSSWFDLKCACLNLIWDDCWLHRTEGDAGAKVLRKYATHLRILSQVQILETNYLRDWVIGSEEKPAKAIPEKITWRDLPENDHWKPQPDGTYVSEDEGLRPVPKEVPHREDPTKTVTLWSAVPLKE